jgi:hypothetical protein
MIRLHVVVEGQTEEELVNAVLVDHLGAFGLSTDVRCVETSRDKRRVYRGGMLDYSRAKKDLTRWMKEDRRPDAAFTTMFDLYALPADFPDHAAAKARVDVYDRVRILEAAFARDIGDPRFVPYLQVHEFEALLLSEPSCFRSRFHEREQGIQRLIGICSGFSSPELIDDGPKTAPSKRIIAEVPEYEGQKASAGPLLAARIGLEVIRRRCPHFSEWLSILERLDTATQPRG